MSQNRYDYIIAGAGLAGLSLAWHLVHSPLSGKRILVIDSNLDPKHDKTWCFWHKGTPPFRELITKTWQQVAIHIQEDTIENRLDEFPYHSIRSDTFYAHILDRLRNHSTVDFLEGRIEHMHGNENKAEVTVKERTYTAGYVFQSCFVPEGIKKADIQFPLIQHFVGWDVEMKQDLFNPDTFTLMDFVEASEDGIAFIYILPWSSRKALLEYTIFSKAVRNPSFYGKELERYLFGKFKLRRLDYKIARTEYGEIPMQDLPYVPWYAPRILNIGTAAGLTKPSTGYTFSRIQEHTQDIVNHLQKKSVPALPPRSLSRYRAYDLWLLQIMHNHPHDALRVFHDLFLKNSTDSIFRFLAEENSLSQDLKIMSSVPYTPFLRAIWKTKKRLFEILNGKT